MIRIRINIQWMDEEIDPKITPIQKFGVSQMLLLNEIYYFMHSVDQ